MIPKSNFERHLDEEYNFKNVFSLDEHASYKNFSNNDKIQINKLLSIANVNIYTLIERKNVVHFLE